MGTEFESDLKSLKDVSSVERKWFFFLFSFICVNAW